MLYGLRLSTMLLEAHKWAGAHGLGTANLCHLFNIESMFYLESSIAYRYIYINFKIFYKQ